MEELLRTLVDVLGWVVLLRAGCFAPLRVAVADRFLDETFAIPRVEELLRALIGVLRFGAGHRVDRFLGEAFAIPRLVRWQLLFLSCVSFLLVFFSAGKTVNEGSHRARCYLNRCIHVLRGGWRIVTSQFRGNKVLLHHNGSVATMKRKAFMELLVQTQFFLKGINPL